jgi:hypothetical protein
MAMRARPRLLALDTNFVLDLAREADFAHEFREVFAGKGYALRLPPTAVAEVHEQLVAGRTSEEKELAQTAFLNLRRWGIQPIDLSDPELAIAAQFARRVLLKGLLPPEELNDALILSETSTAHVPILVTSDKHLLQIDDDALFVLCSEADLPPVNAAHPKGYCERFSESAARIFSKRSYVQLKDA